MKLLAFILVGLTLWSGYLIISGDSAAIDQEIYNKNIEESSAFQDTGAGVGDNFGAYREKRNVNFGAYRALPICGSDEYDCCDDICTNTYETGEQCRLPRC